MKEHNEQDPTHNISLSFSDLSFWCYDCDSYIYSDQLKNLEHFIQKIPPNPTTLDKLQKEIENLNLQEINQQEETEKKPSKEEFEEKLKNKSFKKIITLTGAGISVSAGIPDFRTPGTGLYSKLEKYNLEFPEQVFDLNFFKKNPQPFYQLAEEFLLYKANPVMSHKFFKKLNDEKMLSMNFTQNIDGLELSAGLPQEKCLQAHGHFRTCHCTLCSKEFSIKDFEKKVLAKEILTCDCGGFVKPDIVFFGEQLPASFFQKINLVKDADCVIVMGTSLKVFPFAFLVEMISKDCMVVLFNQDNVMNDDVIYYQGDIDQNLKTLYKKLNWKID